MKKIFIKIQKMDIAAIDAITSCLIILALICPPAAFSKTFADHCADEYQKTSVCPEDICELGCSSVTTEAGCIMACAPKSCPSISAERCPKDFCVLMEDCSKEKICHYPMKGGSVECGDLAYAGQDVDCCAGLVRRCGVRFLDGTCDMEGKNSMYNLPICIPCGDGVCGQFEDWCNCPEDCKYIPPPKRGMIKDERTVPR